MRVGPDKLMQHSREVLVSFSFTLVDNVEDLRFPVGGKERHVGLAANVQRLQHQQLVSCSFLAVQGLVRCLILSVVACPGSPLMFSFFSLLVRRVKVQRLVVPLSLTSSNVFHFDYRIHCTLLIV